MTKLKLIALLVLAVLVLTLIIQNTESVDTRLLFITVSMPRAVLLLTTAIIGFAAGILASLAHLGRGKKKDR